MRIYRLAKWLLKILLSRYAYKRLALARKSILNSDSFGETEEFLMLSRISDQLVLQANAKARPLVFFDVGANVGIYTDYFWSIGYKVLSIEANKSLAFKMDSAYIFKDVAVLNAAVGAEKYGVTKFYETVNHGLSSLIKPEVEIRYTYEVKNVLLDDYIYLAPLLMKMDIEGAEVEALKGARKILEFVRPILLIELDRMSYKQTLELVGKYGYRAVECYGYRGRHVMTSDTNNDEYLWEIFSNYPRLNFLFYPDWFNA